MMHMDLCSHSDHSTTTNPSLTVKRWTFYSFYTQIRYSDMDSCQAILPDTLRVNANPFQTDLCRNPGYREV